MSERAQVKELFLRARQLPVDERPAWLAFACADDPALRREVESLLAAEDGLPLSFLAAPELFTAPSLAAGALLSHYRVVELLGSGGMGEVYGARDEQLDRDVAIKVLPSFVAGDEDARQRLLKEARAAAALNHPNICTIHDVGEQDGRIYLILERIEGRTLEAVVPAGGLSLEQVVHVGAQIAEALAHAHERGVAHLDLKPGNVVVTPGGRAKVLDFGLAERLAGSEATTAAFGSGDTGSAQRALFGTPPYMSPEQLRGDRADSRSDIWALGLILYEMACGERPFAGYSGSELSTAILAAQPKPLSQRLPAAFRAIVARCLEKDPERRYLSAEQLLTALKQLDTDSNFSSTRRPLRQSLAAVLSLAGLAIVASLVAVTWRRSDDDRKPLGRTMASLESDPPAIAVLPFAAASAGPRDELLELGLADALIERLSITRSVQVKSLASARRFAEPGRDPLAAARQLGATYVVDGTSERLGGLVQVRARLLAVSDGATLWTGDFDEAADRAFLVPGDLAAGITSALRIETKGGADSSPCTGGNPEAYRAFLTGRYEVGRLDPQRLRAAQAAYRRAIDLDPSCSRAYAGLSWTYRALTVISDGDPRESFTLARAAANQAIAIDPLSAEGYTQRGFVEFWHDWNWSAARASFRRALALDPSLPEAHLGAAQLEVTYGRFGAAEEHALQIQQLDPLSPLLNSLSGDILRIAGNLAAADRAVARALELSPDFWHPRFIRGQIELDRGDPRGAIDDLEQARSGSGENGVVLATLALAHATAGEVSSARRILADLESPFRAARSPTSVLASVRLQLGEDAAALALLERAFEERDIGLTWLLADARWNRLRDAPRFQALIERLEFPRRDAPGGT